MAAALGILGANNRFTNAQAPATLRLSLTVGTESNVNKKQYLAQRAAQHSADKTRAAVLAHGPYYPGTCRLLSPHDTALPKHLFAAARFLHATQIVVSRFKGRGLYAKTVYDVPPEPGALLDTFNRATANAASDGRGLLYIIHDGDRQDLVERADWDTYKQLAAMVQP